MNGRDADPPAVSPRERRATVDDAPAIAALIRSLADPFFVTPGGAGAEGFLQSVAAPAIAGHVSSADFDYRLLEDAGRLVAIGALRGRRHLYHLFVASSHQGRGLARGLWERLRDAAVAGGHAGPFTVNASLVATDVYARFGFVPAGDVQRVHGIAFRPMVLHPADPVPDTSR